MPTALFTHSDCLGHDNGPGHPERPERLRAILDELGKPEYAALVRCEAPFATIDQIAQVHDRAYVKQALAAVPCEGIVDYEGDVGLSPCTDNAALRAAGAVIAAIDAVMAGKVTNAFCAVRPPGHHAERGKPMGFCLFNNIAIGAAHALRAHKLKRIAILDFDVHHGNGTQAWAESQPEARFVSTHQWPLFPGSGSAKDRGPLKNIVNLPMAAGTDGTTFRMIWGTAGLDMASGFAPELVLVSAGFDAHRDDPLANVNLRESDFAWLTTGICELAHTHCQGRVVSVLEGGYNTTALAASVGAHVRALMGV